jgi:hypothetical protein
MLISAVSTVFNVSARTKHENQPTIISTHDIFLAWKKADYSNLNNAVLKTEQYTYI